MLAKTGTWGTQSAELTKQDFADIIETFSQAPVFLGHDASHKDSEPSYGKVIDVNLSDDGNILYGDVVLIPEADKWFSEKRYDSWSIGVPRRKVDGKRVLNHLALLGSTKPAISGLRQVKVSQEFSTEEISAAEFSFSTSQFEEEEFSEMMTEEEKKKMQSLEEEVKRLKEEAAKNAEGKDEGDKKKEDEKRFSDMQAELKSLKEQNRKARLDAFSAKISGRIPEGVKAKVDALAEKFADCEPCEFSDGNGGKTSVSALDTFAEVLSCGFKADEKITQSVFDANEFSDDAGKGKENFGAKIASKI